MADVKLFWRLFDMNGGKTGGAASTTLKIMRTSDEKLFDWSDSTFKSSGWTSLTTTLSEQDATNLPGVYRKTVTVTTWTDGEYHAFVEYTGTPKNFGDWSFDVLGGVPFKIFVRAR